MLATGEGQQSWKTHQCVDSAQTTQKGIAQTCGDMQSTAGKGNKNRGCMHLEDLASTMQTRTWELRCGQHKRKGASAWIHEEVLPLWVSRSFNVKDIDGCVEGVIDGGEIVKLFGAKETNYIVMLGWNKGEENNSNTMLRGKIVPHRNS